MPVRTYFCLVIFWIILSLLILPALLKIAAPYGRHTRKGWGPSVSNTLGWILMEIVSPAVFAFFFLSGNGNSTVNMLFFALWMIHYINRSLIFPFRLRDNGKRMPLLICLFAVAFNSMNGFLNGYWLGTLKTYDTAWLGDMRFIAGAALFITGFAINLHSDNILLRLRKNKPDGSYQIPTGGFFRWVSCPNYFGEIIEWLGWALATWSLPGFSFALWTAANLIPRALSNHRWYKNYFPDYPKGRKSIFPFLF